MSATTAAAATTSSGSSSSPSLLFHVLTAYLEPLLRKHGNGKTNELITHEDLMASYEAAVAVLRSSVPPAATSTTTLDEDSLASRNNKTVVRERLFAVHQTQLQAYATAARAALDAWAATVPLPEINPTLHDSLAAYQKSCRAVTAATRPLWRDDANAVLATALATIDARAAAAHLYPNDTKPSASTTNDTKDKAGTNTTKDKAGITKSATVPQSGGAVQPSVAASKPEEGEVDMDDVIIIEGDALEEDGEIDEVAEDKKTVPKKVIQPKVTKAAPVKKVGTTTTSVTRARRGRGGASVRGRGGPK